MTTPEPPPDAVEVVARAIDAGARAVSGLDENLWSKLPESARDSYRRPLRRAFPAMLAALTDAGWTDGTELRAERDEARAELGAHLERMTHWSMLREANARLAAYERVVEAARALVYADAGNDLAELDALVQAVGAVPWSTLPPSTPDGQTTEDLK